jgi:hypothetical protein
MVCSYLSTVTTLPFIDGRMNSYVGYPRNWGGGILHMLDVTVT